MKDRIKYIHVPEATEIPFGTNVLSEIMEVSIENESQKLTGITQDFLYKQLDLYDRGSQTYLKEFVVLQDSLGDENASMQHSITNQSIPIANQSVSMMGFLEMSDHLLQILQSKNNVDSARAIHFGNSSIGIFINGEEKGDIKNSEDIESITLSVDEDLKPKKRDLAGIENGTRRPLGTILTPDGIKTDLIANEVINSSKFNRRTCLISKEIQRDSSE